MVAILSNCAHNKCTPCGDITVPALPENTHLHAKKSKLHRFAIWKSFLRGPREARLYRHDFQAGRSGKECSVKSDRIPDRTFLSSVHEFDFCGRSASHHTLQSQEYCSRPVQGGLETSRADKSALDLQAGAGGRSHTASPWNQLGVEPASRVSFTPPHSGLWY